MVFRIYSEKKPGLDEEASRLYAELCDFLGVKGLKKVRILNRYDVENITPELFEYASKTVFSEPQADIATESPDLSGARVFAVEYLPGQFDQRADSAAQCVQIISRGERPLIRSAKVYALYGDIRDGDVERIKKHVINPVEAREASLGIPATLVAEYEKPAPVGTFTGFNSLDREGLSRFVAEHGLAMDTDDALFCRDYFRREGRDPTVTEIRVIDTYWSDHCRHTTFGTLIDSVSFEDPDAEEAYREYLEARRETGRESKPVCLMDLATVGARLLKKRGLLDRLDESEEINACTVKIDVTVDGATEPWLLLFKNETHNHPTEIEPFGGAATCIGGAIRDPLSGRAYVYGAMRVTGAADPLRPVSETMNGKLPQRKIVTTAAAGYSSYGNQIGLATGIVDEIYHPGYAAKRMEIGAVIGAAPRKNVRRERPEPGDVVILLGGATGRDGCGGATGSSKSHTVESLSTCGAEVQKGNAPEERKLQRLFRDPRASKLIKRCNDFGAGGVSVAVGELAEGLDIDLSAVPKKYEGLDGTELAISESQERMAVVVAAADADAFLALADAENLNAVAVAEVTGTRRLRMRHEGVTIVDISRDFLDSNGAEKHASAVVRAPARTAPARTGSFSSSMLSLASDLNICSKRGLAETFDSTIGAGSVLMPFGGKYQLTPVQAMVQKIPLEKGRTDDCSFMSWGFDPYLTEASPFRGAYLAVVHSICKLAASGAPENDTYLSFQEYFERLGKDPVSWGKPLAALLGAFRAQTELGVAAIGGKDSMSGSFEKLHVPPTLVSFAVTTGKTGDARSPEFKRAGGRVWLVSPEYRENGTPEPESLKSVIASVREKLASGDALSAWAVGAGGVAEGVMKCCFGNGLGFDFSAAGDQGRLFTPLYGSFIVETEKPESDWEYVGMTTEAAVFSRGAERLQAATLAGVYEDKLEPVYRCNSVPPAVGVHDADYSGERRATAPALKISKPRVLIPVFPGTNCEYDSARAVEAAGLEPVVTVLRNRTAEQIGESVERVARELASSQILFIPGGFSGGDEPDGSGKFITAFFRNEDLRREVGDLLDRRDGLILGICNGFQALIKLGLVPYGKITDPDPDAPTLTFNTIGRHQSLIVTTRVASKLSPWLSRAEAGGLYTVPVSHGEGRFYGSEEVISLLERNGQIATQYADFSGHASGDVRFNPNGSACAVEGITSPDGRVFGKMGHSERTGRDLYKNVPGNYAIGLFDSAADYFKSL